MKYIYLFPNDGWTKEDTDILPTFKLEYLGKNDDIDMTGFKNGFVNVAVKGNLEDLKKFGDKWLGGYELHPDYLYKEDDFAGDIYEDKQNVENKKLKKLPDFDELLKDPSKWPDLDDLPDELDILDEPIYEEASTEIKDSYEEELDYAEEHQFDSLRNYTEWNGIFGYDEMIIKEASLGKENLDEYLKNEGIYGYTDDLFELAKIELEKRSKVVIDINDSKKIKDKQVKDSDDDPLEEYFGKYVPSSGKADTLGGEIIRAAERVAYRWFNDGDYYFDPNSSIDSLIENVLNEWYDAYLDRDWKEEHEQHVNEAQDKVNNLEDIVANLHRKLDENDDLGEIENIMTEIDEAEDELKDAEEELADIENEDAMSKEDYYDEYRYEIDREAEINKPYGFETVNSSVEFLDNYADEYDFRSELDKYINACDDYFNSNENVDHVGERIDDLLLKLKNVLDENQELFEIKNDKDSR